jgi:hypothetical protein
MRRRPDRRWKAVGRGADQQGRQVDADPALVEVL